MAGVGADDGPVGAKEADPEIPKAFTADAKPGADLTAGVSPEGISPPPLDGKVDEVGGTAEAALAMAAVANANKDVPEGKGVREGDGPPGSEDDAGDPKDPKTRGLKAGAGDDDAAGDNDLTMIAATDVSARGKGKADVGATADARFEAAVIGGSGDDTLMGSAGADDLKDPGVPGAGVRDEGAVRNQQAAVEAQRIAASQNRFREGTGDHTVTGDGPPLSQQLGRDAADRNH